MMYFYSHDPFEIHRRLQVTTRTLLAIAVAAALGTRAHAAEADAGLRGALERITQQRIFFGHQSVGVNLLDGIEQLAVKAGVPVRIAEVNAANKVGPATFGHTFVAENGSPIKKLQSFEQAMGSQPAGVGIAFLKLCYVDFTPETNVEALFADYQAAINRLRAKNPGTTFIHVTVPLTQVQGGLKALVKKLLGRAPYGVEDNVRRERYNNLLRQAYNGREPVFDLARVESTAPDGTVFTVEWKDSVTPAMLAAYTDDGGHLNAVGKLRAARELISILASVPESPFVGRALH